VRRKQSLSYGANKEIKSVPAMRMYYKYVRRTYHPELNTQGPAAKKLINYYISIRPQGANTKSLRITMRSLGDLVRFSEASARAHFRNEVTEKDADIAIKLVSSSIASSGFNQFTEEYLPLNKPSKKSLRVGDVNSEKLSGFITAADLLKNKKGDLVMQELDVIARKRKDRFYRDVAIKMKKFVRLIKAYGLIRCRDCRGDGYVYDGPLRNTCYNCKGLGGDTTPFDYTDITSILLQYGLNANDVQEFMKVMIKKQIITSDFRSKTAYHPVNDYRTTLLDLAAIEVRVESAFEDSVVESDKEKREKKIDPALRERITQMGSKVPEALRKKVSKELQSVEEDDGDEDGDEEEEE